MANDTLHSYLNDNMGAYLRACKDGEARIRRWRLMVLGPSGDGKTSLIDRLLGKGFTEKHVVTNGLETDCKVEITHCDREWKEYEADHLNLLDESITQSIGQEVNRPIAEGENLVKFDEMMDQEEQLEAEKRLESISKSMDSEERATDETVEFLKFILSIWDLGGQVMYYALHHIFLRWHCVYVLVVNLSRDLHSKVPSHELPPHNREKQMEYYQSVEFWLNMIFSHMVKGEQNFDLPNVVLVGTHKDLLHENPQVQDRLADEYFQELQSLLLNRAHFQQVHSQFIAVDSKGGDPENYAKLRKLIFDLVEGHCNQSRCRPIKWLRLEKKLHELKNDRSLTNLDQNLVTYDKAMDYAKKLHIQTDDDLKVFLEYHHLTADITYCPGDSLKNFIVPHPQWLVDVLRALITLEQFYPKSQKRVQEMKQLQEGGLLKSNGSLLDEVWKPFLKGDSSGSAKQYLLSLMVEFDLAVKYAEDQYIIPCLLPVSPSSEPPVFQGLVQNLPSLYYLFHSSVESFVEVTRGDEAYDNFLPHGLFQKLVAKCSKQGWSWTDDRYQDSVTFTTENVLISLQAKSTWIVMNAFALDHAIAVNYSRYQSTITALIKELLNQYHPNMWFELGVNPCAKVKQECVFRIGSTSFDEGSPNLQGVTCKEHVCSLTTPHFMMWYLSSSCRVLNVKDLKRVGNELTDEWIQLNVATELDVPTNEIQAINADTPEIKMASFKILKSWFDQQVYKVKAFATLCDALEKSNQAGLIRHALKVVDSTES